MRGKPIGKKFKLLRINIILRIIVDALWYVRNDIHADLGVLTINNVIAKEIAKKHEDRLHILTRRYFNYLTTVRLYKDSRE